MEKSFVIRCRAIILSDKKLLVVRHPHDTSFVALPGGHLEWGEDVRECMEREIIEELGVRPVLGRLLYVHTFLDRDSVQSLEFFFEVTNGNDFLDTIDRERSHAHEIAEILWVDAHDDVRILPQVIADDLRSGSLLSDMVRFTKG